MQKTQKTRFDETNSTPRLACSILPVIPLELVVGRVMATTLTFLMSVKVACHGTVL